MIIYNNPLITEVLLSILKEPREPQNIKRIEKLL